MAHPHNSRSTVRIVLPFYIIKGATRDMDIILMVFLKKDIIQGSFVFLAQKWYVLLPFLNLVSGIFFNFAQ